MTYHVDEPLDCPFCILTFASSAKGRYQQLQQLVHSVEWQQLHMEQYQYIYLPDSKVYHAADQINRWAACQIDKSMHCT